MSTGEPLRGPATAEPRPSRPSRPRLALAAAVLLGVLALASAPAAADARTFLRGFGEPAFENDSAAERAFWYDQSIRANSSIARINVSWRSVVGGGKPGQAADPADLGYSFTRTDNAVSDAAARGQRILITVFDAPEFAEGANQPKDSDEGTWRPDPAALREFAQALATRYSGSFVPLGAVGALPRVGYFEAWNEPNLSQYLTPQYTEGENKQLSADLYRQMLNAFYAGVKRSGSGAAVVAGATAPYGDPPGNTRTRPLRFLREVFCLNGKLKPTRCKDEAQFDVLSHHPITLGKGPGYSAIHPDDAAMADFDVVVDTLRAAEKQHTVRGPKRHPAWATEFWWETKPPDTGPSAVPVAKHARWVEKSLHSLWRQGAEAAIYLRLQDDASQADGIGGEQSGLFTHDKVEKLSFQAFRFPFVAERVSKKKVNVWTIPPATGTLEIQAERGGDFTTIDRMDVSDDKPDQKKIELRGKAKLRGLLGGEASLSYDVK